MNELIRVINGSMEDTYVLNGLVVNRMHVVVFYDGYQFNASISCKKGWPYAHFVYANDAESLARKIMEKIHILTMSMIEEPDYE